LYQSGDLTGDDYLTTFNTLPIDEGRWYHIGGSKQKRRNVRILDRAKTGFPREIGSWGVKRSKGNQVVLLNWKHSPGDVKQQLDALFG
jgi:hypothetical protein